jgi:hypothetical protein
MSEPESSGPAEADEPSAFNPSELSATEPFFLSVSDCDLVFSVPSAHGTEEDAIKPLLIYGEEHGGGGLVFKCFPVALVKPRPRPKSEILRLDDVGKGPRP